MAADEQEEQVKTEESKENKEETAKQPKEKKPGKSIPTGVLVIVLIVLLSVPFIITRFNVFGSADRIRPNINSKSIFRYLLPTVKDPNDIKQKNREELLEMLNEKESEIAQLEEQIAENEGKMNEISSKFTGSADGLKKFEQEKADVENQKAQISKELKDFEAMKAKFFEEVKNADKISFKQYYEKISPQIAKQLYTEIMQEEKESNSTKDFVSYYEMMDVNTATKILSQLSVTKIDMVADILKYMDKQKASKILQNMDVGLSSRLISLMANK